MKDILLVEDQTELSALIAGFLRKDGYDVMVCQDGEAAVHFLETERTRLLLLDICLPGMDGFAVCSQVRRQGTVPIVMISALSDKENKMKGYELGADDYVEKPIDIDLLRMKIKAILQRTAPVESENHKLQIGEIVMDTDAMAVYRRNEKIDLNVKEYELLLLLFQNAGKTLNKDYIFNKIWGVDSFSENQTLTVHIKRLRDKIEENPKKPERIVTVWGVGYKYEKI